MNPESGLLLKNKRKAVKPLLQLHQQERKPCSVLGTTFLSHIENAAFMWVQDGYKKGTNVMGSNVIPEKVKSFYDNLQGRWKI